LLPKGFDDTVLNTFD